MSVQGPLAENLDLHLLTGASNVLGYLSGTETVYDVDVDTLIDDQELKLDQRTQTDRNVFHDFYAPTIYQGASLKGQQGAYRFLLEGRAEIALDDPSKVRAGAALRQSIGDFEVLTGISNSDLFGDDSQNQYQVGFSYADTVRFLMETDSFSDPNLLNAELGVNVEDLFYLNSHLLLSSVEQENGSQFISYAGMLGMGSHF